MSAAAIEISVETALDVIAKITSLVEQAKAAGASSVDPIAFAAAVATRNTDLAQLDADIADAEDPPGSPSGD
jgi:hypothetical protein